MNRRLALLCALACVTPSMLHAQDSAPAKPRSNPAPSKPAVEAPADDNEVEAVVVTGGKLRGAVLGDIPPEETLSAADVRSFGVSSMSDLLAELSPQTTSGRGGSPVVLLNGRRISSFAEIRDIPTEAIQRVEILPEEVALKYGYSAEQKVVNVVLRQRFRANTVEGSLAGPTEGGQTTEQANASSLRLNRDGRVNLAIKYQHSDELLESDRDLTSSANDPSGGRTLLPKTQQLTANAVINRMIGKVNATVNATATASDSTALLGQNVNLSDPEQNSRDLTGHLGFTLDSDIKAWRWSVTGNYDHDVSRTLTDRTVDSTDRARSTSDTGNVQLVVNGALYRLPAGDLSTTLKLGAEASHLDAVSRRSSDDTDSDLSRNSANAQLSLDLPLTSRKNNVLAPLGDLSANLNLAVNHLSDFGDLTTIGYGLSWSPVKPLSLIASMTRQENAPTIQQLGGPQLSTPDVRVFDFVRGETVDVIRVSGGNPDLKAEERHVLKLGATFKPSNITGLSISANYFRTRTDNPIAAFPAITAAIQDAFPNRFTRDVADNDETVGRLRGIDSRPVNFARQESDQLRWGLNFSRQIGKTPPRPPFDPERFRQGQGQGRDGQGQGRGRDQAAAQTEGQPPGAELLQGALRPGASDRQPSADANAPPPPGAAGDGGRSGPGPGGDGFGPPGGPGGPGGGPGGGFGGGRGGGFGGGGFPGAGAARLQLAFYHTIHLRERVLIDEGQPALDLLNGDAIGSGGGQPRHEIEAQAGITKNGLGARLSANWQSATSVRGGTAGAPTDLHFGDLATLNLRLFANLGARRELVAAHPFLRGARVTLSATNLFNSRMDVRDQNGGTPVNYQPDYLDPLGRSLQISIRKLLF